MKPIEEIKVLDHGYVKYIGHMGSDESFVEAARMSTGKGFLGWYWEEDTWSNCFCGHCDAHHLLSDLPVLEHTGAVCTACWSEGLIIAQEDDILNIFKPKLLGKKGSKRDLNLLTYLYSNKHSTPFEMGELCIEVKAPIFVFREWHRHRTQSYNEFSARYSVMPNEHYVPEVSRFAAVKSANKQAGSVVDLPVTAEDMAWMPEVVSYDQQFIYSHYNDLLDNGVPKEVARINTPVSRYSKMRAKTDIRNWLAFLMLRMNINAQWEIRQYANAVASIIKELFPKTFDLFLEYDLLSESLSRTEVKILAKILKSVDKEELAYIVGSMGVVMTDKQIETMMAKFTNPKDVTYRETVDNL